MPKYRVTGPSAFNGYESGESFTATLPPDQEARAIARGAIEKVAEPKANPFAIKPSEDADSR